jgi:NADH:ubiquinone oxidoreductase subunit F (NADH-binding)
MAVNIDEGEPGTFKDRYYLERDPHRFLEGMLIAAWAVGIEAIYIYLRDEYHGCRALLERELARLQARPPHGYGEHGLPKIELRRGAGAYICGEESAMIESDRGQARRCRGCAPPMSPRTGLFGRPTLEHNLETLHWVRDILSSRAPPAYAEPRPPRPQAACARSRCQRPRASHPGVQPRARRHHGCSELVDEHCGGMAGRPRRSTPTCPAAPPAASCRPVSGPRAARLRHACSRTAASLDRPP